MHIGLSREHALVWWEEGKLRVENKSNRGTRRNGHVVVNEVLDDGDVLQLGDSFLLVRLVPRDIVDAVVRGIVGASPAAARVRANVRLVAPTAATVLLLGPTGAGKDVVARALHDESARTGAFVPVKAASFVGDADAVSRARSAAANGTLYIDEIGDAPLDAQPALLRIVDEKRDMRLVVSSNADLDAKVAAGTLGSRCRLSAPGTRSCG